MSLIMSIIQIQYFCVIVLNGDLIKWVLLQKYFKVNWLITNY